MNDPKEPDGAGVGTDSLIDATYEVLNSDDGFQDLMDSWDDHLETVRDDNARPKLLQRLGHHLRRSSSLFGTLALPPPIDPVRAELERTDAPCIVISGANTVIDANPAAMREWHVTSGETTDYDWIGAESVPIILDSQAALRRGEVMESRIVNTHDAAEGRSAMAEIYPLVGTSLARPPLVIRALRQRWSEGVEAVLMSSFRLTPGEIAVARDFSDCGDTAEVATRRQTSPDTIRKQLKSIFSKMEVSNQAQLQKKLGLVATVAQASTPDNGRGIKQWRDPLGREEMIEDRDGRKIAVTWMGHPSGTPALLSHGTLTGYMLHGETRQILYDSKVKLIVPTRAGFGHTDNFSELSALEAADLIYKTVLDHHGLETIPAVGLISGVVPLLHQAARDPGRYSRLMVVGGCVPIYKEERLEELPAISRVLLTLQRRAPQVAHLAIQAGYRQVLRHGPSYAVRKIYGNCETDRQTLRDSATLALMSASSKMLTVRGIDTFMRDLDLINYDWEEDFATSGLDLTVLQGTMDPVFRPSHASAMAETYPRYRIQSIENSGQLVFLQSPVKVGHAIAEFVRGESV